MILIIFIKNNNNTVHERKLETWQCNESNGETRIANTKPSVKQYVLPHKISKFNTLIIMGKTQKWLSFDVSYCHITILSFIYLPSTCNFKWAFLIVL